MECGWSSASLRAVSVAPDVMWHPTCPWPPLLGQRKQIAKSGGWTIVREKGREAKCTELQAGLCLVHLPRGLTLTGHVSVVFMLGQHAREAVCMSQCSDLRVFRYVPAPNAPKRQVSDSPRQEIHNTQAVVSWRGTVVKSEELQEPWEGGFCPSELALPLAGFTALVI